MLRLQSNNKMIINEIWDEIVRKSGSTITLYGENSFTYTVFEDSIFIPKANWRITKSEIEIASEKLNNPVFAKNAENSSSYVYAIIFSVLKK